MTDLSGSPVHGRNDGSHNSSTRTVDVTSPSLRRNDGGDRTTTTNHTTATASTESNLFSPRSTAAMALSSISQLFSTETQAAGVRHPHHPPTSGARTMSSHKNTTSSSQTGAQYVNPGKASDHQMSGVSTMTHPQLPPPQSLFRSSSKAAGMNQDSASPSYTENDIDGGAPLPFIPNLPPIGHPPQYRMASGDAPPPVLQNHFLHHTNICTTDGATAMPYSSHHDTDPHSQRHTQPHFYPTTSHPGMMMRMKRQPSFPPSSMPEDPPQPRSAYTSPLQPPHMTMMTMTNPHIGASDTNVPNSHVKQHPRPYDLESQMLPSNHPMMTMFMGQSHLQQQYPPTAVNTQPASATMTPAAGTKRDISSTAHVPNHWATPFHPALSAPSSVPHNHGTPCGSHGHHSSIAASNHHPNPQHQQDHHPHSTPYHPIHRCGSYGSACSGNQNTTHYDVSQKPQPQQQHPQFVPQVVTSGPYHPRSVSWSNNEPLQWVPYSGPPVRDIQHVPFSFAIIHAAFFSFSKTEFPPFDFS